MTTNPTDETTDRTADEHGRHHGPPTPVLVLGGLLLLKAAARRRASHGPHAPRLAHGDTRRGHGPRGRRRPSAARRGGRCGHDASDAAGSVTGRGADLQL